MSTDILSLPVDIPWEQFAITPDMFDAEFNNPDLPPKWRSSISVFYYVVPEEESKDLYPNRRIMYLKVSASITGYNFEDSVLGDEFLDDYKGELVRNDVLDDFETSLLEKITGTLSFYSACEGAILQLAVFPHKSDGEVPLQNFPYVQDFEPKKREVYETCNKSGEILSGSSSNLNLANGLTSTSSTEESDIFTGVSASVNVMGSGGSASVSGEWGTRRHTGEETSNVVTTDASRDKRETQSFNTTINHMYQPLLSYHLGTNRVLWSISPRPNIVESEFNLIRPSLGSGYTEERTKIGRKLEGIQEMFIVVSMPKTQKGLCIQATLDTGHSVPNVSADYDTVADYHLVVMRRTIQACGTFDSKGHFATDRPLPTARLAVTPYVVAESSTTAPVGILYGEVLNANKKKHMILKANARSKFILQRMLDTFSSRTYKPRPFGETDVFKNIVFECMKKSDHPLHKIKSISSAQLTKLKLFKINTVGDLLKALSTTQNAGVREIGRSIAEKTCLISKKIMDYEKIKSRGDGRA